MAIATTGAVITTALWPQGDIRDPLGVWGMRQGVTGDASGGGIQVVGTVPSGLRAAYVYTIYGITIVQLTGTLITGRVKFKILTNWPNVDPQAGVQAFATAVGGSLSGSTDFAGEPLHIDLNSANHPYQPNDRFILCFDPRPSANALEILDLSINVNSDLATYSFEAYGYWWDRSILGAPGGPRHPGSS